MFQGYLELAGNEIVNSARVVAYVKHALPQLGLTDGWLSGDDLPLALGDDPYQSPLVDNAPWVDPANSDTWGFYGVYPLEVTGGTDGTRSVRMTQLTGDGAVSSRPRSAGKEIMVQALLVAADRAAMEAGKVWLRSALEGGMCSGPTIGCSGDTLCYFTALPPVQLDAPGFTSVEDCVAPYHRTLYRVVLLEGPRVTKTYQASSGVIEQVTFVLASGVPHPYTLPVEVGDALEGSGVVVPEVSCTPVVLDPLIDPDCVTPPSPPRPPVILDSCLESPATWVRYSIDIPTTAVPLWTDAVPVITLTTRSVAVRQVRIRFYPNPFGYDLTDIDECDYCGEFIVSYIPATSDMTISGILETATVSVAGGPGLAATHLLYGSGGAPFEWPTLSCGTGYVMVVDVAPVEVGDLSVNLAIAGRG